jgi:hypothetical protein
VADAVPGCDAGGFELLLLGPRATTRHNLRRQIPRRATVHFATSGCSLAARLSPFPQVLHGVTVCRV